MIAGQCTPIPAESLGVLSALHPWVWLIVAATACLFAWGAWTMARRDRVARFLGAGALLSLLPACATLPQNRNLIFVGIGAFGLLGLWLGNPLRGTVRPRLSKGVAVLLIAIHLVLAPLMLPLTALSPASLESALRPLHEIPGMERIEGRDLIVVNHPLPIDMLLFLGGRAIEGKPLPARTHVLAHAFSFVTVARVSDDRLRVRCDSGFPDLLTLLFDISTARLAVHDRVKTPGMEAEVTATDNEGMPVEALFAFDRKLDDGLLNWVEWRDGAFRPFVPPAIGQSTTLPPIRLPFIGSGADFDAQLRKALVDRQYRISWPVWP